MWSDTEEVALEVALPDTERQAWLLGGLRRLIERRRHLC
jgi:hypothetical protein